MASTTPTNMLITALLGSSIPTYLMIHAWKFDRCRCLVPRRQNAVRTGMVWLLALAMTGFSIWAILLTVQKYVQGWVLLPAPIGMVPLPIPLWSEYQQHLHKVGDIVLVISFCLYDAVNLEEALYWTFLLKSMKHSRSSESRVRGGKRPGKITRYLNSNIFMVWVVLSLVATIAHASVPFAGETDVMQQNIRIFLFEGGVGVINVFFSLILVYYLPGFIRQVQAHGASEDVISKLRFFEELNLIRTIFRAGLAGSLLAQGYSATTEAKALLMNPLSNDLLYLVTVISFWMSNIISVMLYLPISLSEAQEDPAHRLVKRRVTHGGLEMGPDARRASMRPGTIQTGKAKHQEDDFEDPLSQLRSHHSYEHRTLVTLLRERGTIQENERVPEDDLFDLDGPLEESDHRGPRETRIGVLNVDDERREFGDDSFITSPLSQLEAALKRKSDHSEKASSAPLPPAITLFSGPFQGIPHQLVAAPDVVIEVSREVEVTHEEHVPSIPGTSYPPGTRR